MLFGKYHLVIFKEKCGSTRNLRFRGGFGLLAAVLVVALAASNCWLWVERQKVGNAQGRLEAAEQTIEEQNNQILALTTRIAEVQNDLDRVRQFDAKLRLMMNMESDPETTSVGGSRDETLALEYLPLRRHDVMVRKMNTFLKQLSGDIRLEEVRQQELLHTLRASREALASVPSIWPIEGFITSRFGGRADPFTGRNEQHKGIDISARTGTPIYAPGKGTVIFSGVENGYGHTVLVQHGGGITTRYAHMSRRAVTEGQTVQRGDVIGYVGSTGRSSGPHLHYEVRLNGVNVDPLRYILN